MKTCVINLPRPEARRRAMTKQIGDLSLVFEFVARVDWRKRSRRGVPG